MPIKRKKLMSKHDDPSSSIEFRNWRKDLNDLIESFPRGVECVAAECSNLPTNRGAFLCKDCGIKYYDVYKNIASVTERAKAQYNWLKKYVLVQE